MKTNDGLITYAKAMVGKPYWYGTFGQTSSAALYASKRKQYPQYYRCWDDFPGQYGQRVHDCVGLVKGYIWSDNITAPPKYNSNQDVSAFGMYCKSKTKGHIAEFPGTEGALVYKSGSASYMGIHHVGVYSGGYVYEAKGHEFGVVKTKFDKADWNFWSLCPFISYNTESKDTEIKSVEDIAREVLDGKWGNNPDRREMLIKSGYDYDAVQKMVNQLIKTPIRKSNEEVAREVAKGRWGNNPERRQKLEAAGYDYETIRQLVNMIIYGG